MEVTVVIIGADTMGAQDSGPPQKFGCRVFCGSDPHENFTEINLVTAKLTPGADL